MKIVISKQYSGFELTPRLLEELLKLKDIKIYWYKKDREYKGKQIPTPYSYLENERYVKVDRIPEDVKGFEWDYRMKTFDFGDEYLFDYQVNNDKWFNADVEIDNETLRTDPLVISLIEKYADEDGIYREGMGEGKDRRFMLQVIEIPDDVKYYIDSYDGKEWVAEEHRTWGRD